MDCADAVIVNIDYLEGELSRIVKHTAGVHKGQHIPHHIAAEDLLVGDGTDAAIGQSCCDHRQALAVDLDTACLS